MTYSTPFRLAGGNPDSESPEEESDFSEYEPLLQTFISDYLTPTKFAGDQFKIEEEKSYSGKPLNKRGGVLTYKRPDKTEEPAIPTEFFPTGPSPTQPTGPSPTQPTGPSPTQPTSPTPSPGGGFKPPGGSTPTLDYEDTFKPPAGRAPALDYEDAVIPVITRPDTSKTIETVGGGTPTGTGPTDLVDEKTKKILEEDKKTPSVFTPVKEETKTEAPAQTTTPTTAALPELGKTPQTLAMTRFQKPGGAGHFYTANVQEGIGAGFAQEGPSFNLFADSNEAEGATDIYRLFNPTTGKHFFTANKQEADTAAGAGYNIEGVAGEAYTTARPGTTAVERYYNPAMGAHLYTSSPQEQETLPGLGYTREGTAFYAPNQTFESANKIDQAYEKYLGVAEPDKEGFDYWMNEVTSGKATLDDTLKAIGLHPTSQSYLKNKQTPQPTSSPPAQSSPAQIYQQSVSLPTSSTPTQASPAQEYEQSVSLPITNESKISLAYNQYLGRAPDKEGFDYWTKEAASTPSSIDQIINNIKNSKEAQERNSASTTPAPAASTNQNTTKSGEDDYILAYARAKYGN